MRITDLLRFARERGEPIFSFEFFPPKTDDGVRGLFETVEALRPLGPAYVSVTYGAGGSTRAKTIDLVKRLKRDAEVEAMAHVTCVGASREEIAAVLDEVADAGIQNVLALRGDAPRGQSAFVPHPDGFTHASELVAFIRSRPERWRFCVGAAAYPEGHVETRDLAQDLRNLKLKVEAGTDFLVTQLFFENAHYFRFVERARAAGVEVPVVPGIMPFTNVEQVERFTAMCGAAIPPPLRAAMEVRRADPDGARELGVAYATLQCADLLRRGAPGIHFYTLNRSPSTRAIVAALRASEPWRG
ncbi:methylenetetrahydrofolate reductase [NAD(P)H] [Anaeromyxobacter dehalogenans]|uniref:Methylenetetrahydrofolate reductase n=1 Tax=Anaeromyxobacter dehalogenans (strain 2CP-C) TaxID=290397 RepID=Q2ILB5_ANADE|nr:methylenetetrahydrofolate reductase [NAD(P)H] [Anaeromyxobacter dehalogenans]ABC82446.1 5,10-methylenetetrahydrofolate reductase [Anaeromyxobacter dehalogenans 2CP-C]